MSTRPGKRIHNSFQENADQVDKQLVVMSKRKTKSTRFKENKEDSGLSLFQSKKRNNYVSYPKEDENLLEPGDTYDTDVKHRRLTRRNALKEQNIEVPLTENSDNFNTTNTQVRVTRRTKKLSENYVQNEEKCESSIKQESVTVQTKNSKKNKNLHVEEVNVIVPVVVKKKSKKNKGNKSNSQISDLRLSEEENLNDNFNISTDSFYSTFDSPIYSNGDNDKSKTKMSKNTKLAFDIADGRITKKHDKDRKGTKKEFLETKHKNTTYDSDKSLSESTDSFVFHKGSDVNSTLKIQESRIENILSGEQVSDKETFDPSKIRKSSITHTAYEKENMARTPDDLKLNEKVLSKNSTNNKIHILQKEIDRTCDKEQNSALHSPDIKRKSANRTLKKKDSQQSTKSSQSSNINELPKQHFIFNQNNLNPNRNSAKLNSTFDKNSNTPKELNSTFEIGNNISSYNTSNNKRKSTVINTTFEKETTPEYLELTEKKSSSAQIIISTEHTNTNFQSPVLDNTFKHKNQKESSSYSTSSLNKSMTESFNVLCHNKDPKINTTFEKDSNLSLMSSDDSKCQDISHITITSDNSISQDLNKTPDDDLPYDISDDSNQDLNITTNAVSSKEIMNTTPYLIESSMDETISKTDKMLKKEPVTPLKRQGTFTKDGPDALFSNPAMDNSLKVTPNKCMSLSSPGSTPFPVRSPKGQYVLNVTRSLEKSHRSSIAEPVPRTTRVMFYSPVNNPAVVTHQKRKVIKSNLKGSKKSFIFQDCDFPVRAAPRKRSYTQNDADNEGAKRKRLTDDMQLSIDRLSRPRTSSATAKLTESTTPSKKEPTPSKAISGAKVLRTKLPNFAALHRKQFDKMESLDECQERKAKRARQLLTPTTMTKTKSLIKEPTAEAQKETQKPSTKEAHKKPDFSLKPPTVASQIPGYTRFGFKLNLDVNPFSIISKNTDSNTNGKPKGPVREVTMPSMTGATSLRREIAKQVVMREKSFTQKNKNETRSIIKGVRTNRRFELQMKLRNI